MEASNFSPIQNYLLIEQEEPPQKTENGLYIPDNEKTCATGVVQAAGPGYRGKGREMVVEPGDRVLYLEASGRTFPSADKTLRLVRQTNIFATIDGATVMGAYQTSA